MALTFSPVVKPRRLVLAEARDNTSANWVAIPGVAVVAWRPETVIWTQYAAFATNSAMVGYKPDNPPMGWGRRVVGVLWTRSSEAVEELVAHSHLSSANNAYPLPTNSIGFRAKFNTGLNVNNFRYIYKQFQPVIFGAGYGAQDYLHTLKFPDKGLRGLFAVPFRVSFDCQNAHFNTTNSAAAGVYTEYTNT